VRVVVHLDPTRCRGHGMCALLFPDGLELDRWGFGRSLDVELDGRRHLRQAHRAARACPNGAISVFVAAEADGSLQPG